MQKIVTGKKAVMEAVVEAAADLFAEKPPGRVTIREIADHAGINHGLIHRHFGSKHNLIITVTEYIDDRIRSEAEKGKTFKESFKLASEAAFKDPRIWRVPAMLVMDGQTDLLINQFSYLNEFRKMADREYGKSVIGEIKFDEIIFLMTTLGFGMEMFGDYISKSMKIDKPETGKVLNLILNLLEQR